MKIDNRIFITPAFPFVLLGLARVFWWVAGLEWGGFGGQLAVGLIFVLGLSAGGILTLGMFEAKVSLGSFTIGKRNA